MHNESEPKDDDLKNIFALALDEMCGATRENMEAMIKKFTGVAKIVLGRPADVCESCAVLIDAREQEMERDMKPLPDNVKTWQGIFRERRPYVGC